MPILFIHPISSFTNFTNGWSILNLHFSVLCFELDSVLVIRCFVIYFFVTNRSSFSSHSSFSHESFSTGLRLHLYCCCVPYALITHSSFNSCCNVLAPSCTSSLAYVMTSSISYWKFPKKYLTPYFLLSSLNICIAQNHITIYISQTFFSLLFSSFFHLLLSSVSYSFNLSF